jgi:RNA polymerase sigma factor (TIGR02999 family)
MPMHSETGSSSDPPSDGLDTRPRSVSEEIWEQLYGDLRAIAARQLERDRTDHTLQPTAVVHECWLKLQAHPDFTVHDEMHFRALAARAMRQVLVDYARRNKALRRGGDRYRVSLPAGATTGERSVVDVVALDAALEELAELHPRQARIVELRYFAAMTVEDVAAVVGVSSRTVAGDWQMARGFLWERLAEPS